MITSADRLLSRFRPHAVSAGLGDVSESIAQAAQSIADQVAQKLAATFVPPALDQIRQELPAIEEQALAQALPKLQQTAADALPALVAQAVESDAVKTLQTDAAIVIVTQTVIVLGAIGAAVYVLKRR